MINFPELSGLPFACEVVGLFFSFLGSWLTPLVKRREWTHHLNRRWHVIKLLTFRWPGSDTTSEANVCASYHSICAQTIFHWLIINIAALPRVGRTSGIRQLILKCWTCDWFPRGILDLCAYSIQNMYCCQSFCRKKLAFSRAKTFQWNLTGLWEVSFKNFAKKLFSFWKCWTKFVMSCSSHFASGRNLFFSGVPETETGKEKTDSGESNKAIS